MTPLRIFFLAGAMLSVFAEAGPVRADPCPGGGTLTINAAADSLSLAPAAATTFNFGEHVILSATASGTAITGYAWTVDGPTIKDYNENLGTENLPLGPAPLPWSTTPLGPADLAASTVGFYWVPTAAQFEPNNGPFSRNVTLTATLSGGGTCTATASFMVERNETDITRQAEDFYTSNHRAATTTNPLFGHVVEEHIFWHANIDGAQATSPAWAGFLAWHGEFIRRFDLWRQEFGYDKVSPWYPGRALPTGPQFDADPGLRLVYNPDANRLPTYYTITGGSSTDFGGQAKLADYATLANFTGSFEGGFHGQVHCNIGVHLGTFRETSGPGYGSMCNASSPKDPMFWRWHGFIDLLYRNYCALHSGACASPSPVDPPADPWMADNNMDIADNGTTPSPGTHWISPDVWSRRAQVTTDACVAPIDSYGDHDTSGGVVRDCGSSADHENPVTGVTNYLYGTLRNTRPQSAGVAYVEVGVYYALASTGLHYPTDFTLIPESRQFIAVQTQPGTTTAIGPIPWTPPPLPPANDHYCLYLRVLSVQATPPLEGLGIDTDVANNNNLAWRNIKVVAPGDNSPPSFFIVRNFGREAERLALRFEFPEAFLAGRPGVRVTLDGPLVRALEVGRGRQIGFRNEGKGRFVVARPLAAFEGLVLPPRGQGHVRIDLGPITKAGFDDITITQIGPKGVEGGITLRATSRK